MHLVWKLDKNSKYYVASLYHPPVKWTTKSYSIENIFQETNPKIITAEDVNQLKVDHKST